MSGLDDLAAQRQKATSRRKMPAPKRPARTTPVDLPQSAPAEVPADSAGGVATTPAIEADKVMPIVAAATASSPKAASVKPTRKAPENTAEDLARYSIYLDTTLDDYLSDVIDAGRRRRPRLTVSRSSVVRLALTELASRMDSAQVVAELAARAPASTTGRPRL